MDETIKIQEKKALHWLSLMPDLEFSIIRKIWEQYHSFVQLYYIEETDLPPELKNRLKLWLPHRMECEERYEEMLRRGIRFITVMDEEYPDNLRNLPDYPMQLYVKGRLPDPVQPSLAIVGARSCSSHGRQVAEYFARMLSAEGVQIISGLALGIDGAAHLGAVKAGQPTFAVLGCGVNICYPSSHYHLYEAILANGGIISEYGLDVKPRSFHFPMRNRIISALSDGIVVVEAKEKSGSLITAELGLEQGKELFAVPGRITDPLSKGCNQLIVQGANMVISPEDILETFSIKRQKKLILCEKNINRLANKEKMVYSCLDFTPKHLDRIADDCKLSISECLAALLALEISEYVVQTANHYYEKKL